MLTQMPLSRPNKPGLMPIRLASASHVQLRHVDEAEGELGLTTA